ncbi:MAG: DUF445 family protein [Acidobacteria bacterium]|nr:DUF445 family protein [Acidobacteriota bacterium]
MEYLQQNWIEVLLLVTFATVHGYFGAWLAVRMLFRPRRPVKLLGLTIFPQGMVPRHRERLASAIGKAVGEELVSQETIVEELFGKEFLRKRSKGWSTPTPRISSLKTIRRLSKRFRRTSVNRCSTPFRLSS